MNPDLSKLQPYPFEKLAKLKGEVTPPADLEHIALSIGEPKHPAPEFVLDTLRTELQRVENYPTTKGLPELNSTIASWLERRFSLANVDPVSQVIPVNGTREAIFAFTQAVVNRCQYRPLVVSPNPFYQIYEGAAYLSGAEPHFLPCLEENGFNPDYDAVPEEIWHRCQMLFVCTPGNPTGSTLKLEDFKKLIDLADQYDFVLASDECYSEIYVDGADAPMGLLEACEQLGRKDFKRCVVFHSLSKRSNLPGLRSGFIAGDEDLLKPFLLYRTYHGCAMPVHTQLASIAAWSDEQHVIKNRQEYTQKFSSVLDILSPVLDVKQTEASFYLWPKTPINEETFAQQLFAQQNVTVLPGSYLSRTVDDINPGSNRIRMALVAPTAECTEAALRIRSFIESL
ncbi:succinyldiaminopimelate transaminase [Thalassolituus sp. UBA3500]|uniref:succinyldiaminopimelate transaminase n=1 Tax=Thalassolituus sp. UBA3500 TaxID=1947664 RepID=UPI000C0EB793|nr:succinyldiaminopimelate transaminase [Thalassolituus sp. UBA3500]MBN59048.1 succinyldiaminopimelate transaminase [Oceanospirillaceae bacterium]|tara:strand:- start:394 stop:1587 length:1194 start_codon:yes stop_codon:yes gene_type:complete